MQFLNCTGSMEWCVNLSKCAFYAVLHSENNNKQKLTKFMTLATLIPKKIQALICAMEKLTQDIFQRT